MLTVVYINNMKGNRIARVYGTYTVRNCLGIKVPPRRYFIKVLYYTEFAFPMFSDNNICLQPVSVLAERRDIYLSLRLFAPLFRKCELNHTVLETSPL